jgi:hypothetical protein
LIFWYFALHNWWHQIYLSGNNNVDIQLICSLDINLYLKFTIPKYCNLLKIRSISLKQIGFLSLLLVILLSPFDFLVAKRLLNYFSFLIIWRWNKESTIKALYWPSYINNVWQLIFYTTYSHNSSISPKTMKIGNIYRSHLPPSLQPL